MRWTYEEKLFLEQNYRNYNVKQIARKLDRTEESIRQQARTMGVTRFTRNVEDRIVFIKEHAGKMKTKQMARELDCSVTAIHQLAFRLGISLKVKPSDEEVEEMRRMIEDGHTYGQVADAFPQYHESSIWRYVNEAA